MSRTQGSLCIARASLYVRWLKHRNICMLITLWFFALQNHLQVKVHLTREKLVYFSEFFSNDNGKVQRGPRTGKNTPPTMLYPRETEEKNVTSLLKKTPSLYIKIHFEQSSATPLRDSSLAIIFFWKLACISLCRSPSSSSSALSVARMNSVGGGNQQMCGVTTSVP